MAEKIDLQNCCRICTTRCEGICSLFEVTHHGKRPVDLLEYCFQQTIDTSECYPDIICSECSTNLIETYEFFVLYKRSEQYFQSFALSDTQMTDTSDKIVIIESSGNNVITESNEFIAGYDDDIDAPTNEYDLTESDDDDVQFSQEGDDGTQGTSSGNIACDVCNKVYIHRSSLWRHRS